MLYEKSLKVKRLSNIKVSSEIGTQKFEMGVKQSGGSRHATRNLSGQRRFCVGQFNKHFVKNTRKKGIRGNIVEFFLLNTLKTTF